MSAQIVPSRPRATRWRNTRRMARRNAAVRNWNELANLPRLSRGDSIPYDRYTPWSLHQECPVCKATMKQKCHKNRKGGGKVLARPHQERVVAAQRYVAPMCLPRADMEEWERELLGLGM